MLKSTCLTWRSNKINSIKRSRIYFSTYLLYSSNFIRFYLKKFSHERNNLSYHLWMTMSEDCIKYISKVLILKLTLIYRLCRHSKHLFSSLTSASPSVPAQWRLLILCLVFVFCKGGSIDILINIISI